MTALRIGLYTLLAFAVFSLGAVDVWAQSVLEIGAALLLIGWAFAAWRNPEIKIRWSPLNWPFLGLIAIAALQLAFGGTASVFRTRTELLRLACYFVLFFLMFQAFRARQDWVRLAWFAVCLCFVVSSLGIIQHFTSADEIYWMSSLKTTVQPFGPYVNRNHFAGFAELTLPVGLAFLIFRGIRKDLFALLILLTVIPIGAVILSASRGGITSVAFEIGILLLLAPSIRSARRTRNTGVPVIAILVLAAIAFAGWIGTGRTLARFSALGHPEVTLSRRVSMASGAIRVFFAHPVAGCGLGALVDVFPRYETDYDGRVIDHVHNDYLETLAEAGIPGGLCGLAFLWIFYRESKRNWEAEQGRFSRAFHAGAIAAVCGLLLHSFVDFNLHIPANALLFLLQICVATSPPLPSAVRSRAFGRRGTQQVRSAEIASA